MTAISSGTQDPRAFSRSCTWMEKLGVELALLQDAGVACGSLTTIPQWWPFPKNCCDFFLLLLKCRVTKKDVDGFDHGVEKCRRHQKNCESFVVTHCDGR